MFENRAHLTIDENHLVRLVFLPRGSLVRSQGRLESGGLVWCFIFMYFWLVFVYFCIFSSCILVFRILYFPSPWNARGGASGLMTRYQIKGVLYGGFFNVYFKSWPSETEKQYFSAGRSGAKSCDSYSWVSGRQDPIKKTIIDDCLLNVFICPNWKIYLSRLQVLIFSNVLGEH